MQILLAYLTMYNDYVNKLRSDTTNPTPFLQMPNIFPSGVNCGHQLVQMVASGTQAASPEQRLSRRRRPVCLGPGPVGHECHGKHQPPREAWTRRCLVPEERDEIDLSQRPALSRPARERDSRPAVRPLPHDARTARCVCLAVEKVCPSRRMYLHCTMHTIVGQKVRHTVFPIFQGAQAPAVAVSGEG